MTKELSPRQLAALRKRLRKEAAAASCVYCGKPVTEEDRNQDGTYLHRECAYASTTRMAK